MRKKREDGYLTGVRRGLEWILAAVVIGAALVAVVVPWSTGATPYTVLTGSMEPTLPPGTLVVTRPTSMDEIEVGEVVTFQKEPDHPAVVTHRVIGHGVDMRGRTVLWTQGDANASPDPAPVREVQVRGEVWYIVPYLGHVTGFLEGPVREAGLRGVAGLLLAYAAVMMAGAVRDQIRRLSEARHA